MEDRVVERQERFEFYHHLLFSVCDNLLSPLVSQSWENHRLKINNHKKVLLRRPFLNSMNIELGLQEHDKDKEERFYPYTFHTLKSPTETFTCIDFCHVVWLWAMYLTPLISSFLTCKLEIIILFTSNVILKIIRNTACEMLNTRLGKMCSVIIAYEWALSSASSHFLKRKLTLIDVISITEAIWCSKQSEATLPIDQNLLSEVARWITSPLVHFIILVPTSLNNEKISGAE